MENLSSTDWQKLLHSIEILNRDIFETNLAKRLIDTVNYLVSNEISAFDAFDLSGNYEGNMVYEPFGAIAEKDLKIFGELVHEHPLYEDVFLHQKLETMTLTDYISERDFSHTALYNEYFRRIGVAHQINVILLIDEKNLVNCALSRCRQNFGENERLMLNLLKPHLAVAIRNSWLFEQIRKSEETWKAALEHGEHGIIVLNPANKPEFISRCAIRILERFFPDDKLSANYLPLKFWNWVAATISSAKNFGEYSAPPAPLIVKNDGEELKAEICFDTDSRTSTLLLKTKSRLTPDRLLPLGITKTEAKVLYWISMGKTNVEIAILSNISPRTVQKHIEHICNKLGVENRTAAAVRATEVIY